MKQAQTTTPAVMDPVCNMSVDPEATDISATIDGQTYYFCAEGCRKVFEENPQKYLDPQPVKKKGWWCRFTERLEKATGGKPMKCH
jgi:Cu+-exporting ATPase